MLLLVVIVAAALAGLRYMEALDEVRGARESALRLADEARSLDPADLDRPSVDRLRAGLDELEERLVPVEDLLANDPIVSFARQLPAVATQIEAAGALVQGGRALVEAGGIGVGLADRVVTLREANAADPEMDLLPGLVELMATSGDDVDRMAELMSEAGTTLATIPNDAIEQIREAAELVAEPLDSYVPLLDTYRELDDVVPELLGWGGEKRYLVLAQNPAELRPTGGYTGTIGTIVLRDGDIVEQTFEDTYFLSVQEDLPFVEPPESLADYVLGDGQSWRLADANWSADFPTSAQKAAELYAIESDGEEVDGVIAITTYALDRLLEVVGPVEVPEYGVTVNPGDVTLTLLGATRGTPGDIEGRKDVLDALARESMDRLASLPPERWEEGLRALEDVTGQRDMMAWLADPEMQTLVEEAGWAGPVRQGSGDYVYVVESNVAPTSKYNLVVDRTDSLAVELGEDGDAVNSLRLDWQNDGARDGEPYASLRAFSNNEAGWYGSYVRVLTPSDSELLSARGRAFDRIRGVEREEEEANRSVFGNYLLMKPGASRMTYSWSVPGAAVRTDAGWLYELVVQRQPGARAVPISIAVDLPEGAIVRELSEGAVVDGGQVSLETDLGRDVGLRILYDLPGRDA